MRPIKTFIIFSLAITILDSCAIKEEESYEPSIQFSHPLPAMNIDGKRNGTYNNIELAVPGLLTTKDPELGMMMKRLRDNVINGRSIIMVEGKAIPVYKNWIRDHAHTMKAFRHWERDPGSFLDFILSHQRPDGSFYELIKQMDDPHWSFVGEDDLYYFLDDNLYLARLDIESDVEYMVVEAAMWYYKITGDRSWLKKTLPKLEMGINYLTSDPKRWDPERGLVKRGYTIDTWDFTCEETAGKDRRIKEGTPMAVMHGDNSGVFQAMNQIAWMNQRLRHDSKARKWRERASTLRERTVANLWNGRFFTHEVPINCPPADDKESTRLSLSNTYDINRGLTTLEMSRSIIEEYMLRRDTTSVFAEWFTIDPPYSPYFGSFHSHPAGTYVNGAITSFTAGELAKAAFNNGYEDYGWDIILRLKDLMAKNGDDIHFLYNRYTGVPEDAKMGPAAWGAAAILSAIDEGLAGITDLECRYRSLGFAPKWPVTPYKELRYISGYESNGDIVDVRYIQTEKGLRYMVDSPAKDLRAHILLPRGVQAAKTLLNGKEIHFDVVHVGESVYVDFSCDGLKGRADIEVVFIPPACS